MVGDRMMVGDRVMVGSGDGGAVVMVGVGFRYLKWACMHKSRKRGLGQWIQNSENVVE